MDEFEGLKVPAIPYQEDPIDRQASKCMAFEHFCDGDCNNCIFENKNVDIFIKWEKANAN